MSATVAPIQVEALGLANLRFFAPPSGGQEFPWVCIDDLHACLTLPRALRREFKAQLRTSQWKHDVRTVATRDGLVNIVPHFMAQGLIEAMHEVGQIDREFYGRYTAAGAKALSRLTDGLSPAGLSPAGLLAYIGAAHKASGGSPRGGGEA